MSVITLLAAIFGKDFLNPKVRILLLVFGLTLFTIRARKIFKDYKKAEEEAAKAEQDYKVAMMLQAQQGHEALATPEPKAKLLPKPETQPAT